MHWKAFVAFNIDYCKKKLNTHCASVHQAATLVMKQLVHAFVMSRLDYCNGTLAGLPMRLLVFNYSGSRMPPLDLYWDSSHATTSSQHFSNVIRCQCT